MLDNDVFFAWHPQKPNVVYVGTGKAGLRSDDAGDTWRALGQEIAHKVRVIDASLAVLEEEATALAGRYRTFVDHCGAYKGDVERLEEQARQIAAVRKELRDAGVALETGKDSHGTVWLIRVER